MRKDENGLPCPETLGEYYEAIEGFFGEEYGKRALDFFQRKIKESPNGKYEKVIAPDSQVRELIRRLLYSVEG